MVDRRTTAAESRGALRRGLSPRAERVCRAAIEAILADEDADGRLVPGSPAACDRAVASFTHSAGAASGDLRRGLGVLTFLLQMLPIVVIGAPRRMTSLSLANRVRYLEALETHRFGLFAMLATAFKVPMCIAAFEEGEELASTGFDRPDTVTRRSLLIAQRAEIERAADLAHIAEQARRADAADTTERAQATSSASATDGARPSAAEGGAPA